MGPAEKGTFVINIVVTSFQNENRNQMNDRKNSSIRDDIKKSVTKVKNHLGRKFIYAGAHENEGKKKQSSYSTNQSEKKEKKDRIFPFKK